MKKSIVLVLIMLTTLAQAEMKCEAGKCGMAWSSIHANFLVNLGGGSYEEAIYLLELAKSRVYNQFGIKLEEEIKILSI